MFVACGIIQADKLTATESGDTKNAAATVSGVEGADPSATATAALRLKERDEAMALIKVSLASGLLLPSSPPLLPPGG